MTQFKIGRTKYVLLPEKELTALRKRALLKSKPQKTFTVEEARAYSKKLVRKWAGEK